MAVEYEIAKLENRISALREGRKTLINPWEKADYDAEIEQLKQKLDKLRNLDPFKQPHTRR